MIEDRFLFPLVLSIPFVHPSHSISFAVPFVKCTKILTTIWGAFHSPSRKRDTDKIVSVTNTSSFFRMPILFPLTLSLFAGILLLPISQSFIFQSSIDVCTLNKILHQVKQFFFLSLLHLPLSIYLTIDILLRWIFFLILLVQKRTTRQDNNTIAMHIIWTLFRSYFSLCCTEHCQSRRTKGNQWIWICFGWDIAFSRIDTLAWWTTGR